MADKGYGGETLAINGGTPLVAERMQRPSPLGKEERVAISEVMKAGLLSQAGRGPVVKAFQKEFAALHGSRHALATPSGTTALHAALCSLSVGKGDEVLVPSLTFVSSASVILQQQAIPVFVDADPDTFCMSYADLERKISSRSRALVLVHLYGHPCEMQSIMDLAVDNGLAVIEDCAQAHGASYRGRMVGTFGDAGCFSFFQTKNMTCGEGGMVITDRDEIARACSSVCDHGLIDGQLEGYDYDRLGYNYHMSELNAAVGRGQLSRLNSMNAKRREHARQYMQSLDDTNLQFQSDSEHVDHVFHYLTALLPKELLGKRDWFVKAVREENVMLNKLYPVPLHRAKLFEDMLPEQKCPVAEDIAARLFNFYVDPGFGADDIDLVCNAVRKVLAKM